ncbi:GATA transcription factor 9-like [Humulus lupulus]|uniref:GATA transcription factor 9-like n=1 Tax=Humulus lupulus TaxID=3486 RepID=UPI002B40ACA5|nr:GATA transcription factor 9-like [Humulus lupulus]
MEVPEYLVGGYFGAAAVDFSNEKRQSEQKSSEHFTIDDLLDLSHEEPMVTDGFFDNVAGNSTDSSTVTAVDSCNSSISGGEHQFSGNRSFGDSHFSGDLCVPYEDLAELEWLSNFVEDSFSVEKELDTLQFLSTSSATANTTKSLTSETSSSSETSRNASFFQQETPLPGKARSKRSRAAPGDWTTRLLHLVTPNDDGTKPVKTTPSKKKEAGSSSNGNSDSSGRKCLHCAAEKTPQWRTGPLGPKTLCNACGVRYKSGRLVPEYRPAASPTFVSAKHSNSHRKVLELRRQKDFHRAQHQHFLSQSSIFGVSNGGDDYLIHHHNGPDFRHMI